MHCVIVLGTLIAPCCHYIMPERMIFVLTLSYDLFLPGWWWGWRICGAWRDCWNDVRVKLLVNLNDAIYTSFIGDRVEQVRWYINPSLAWFTLHGDGGARRGQFKYWHLWLKLMFYQIGSVNPMSTSLNHNSFYINLINSRSIDVVSDKIISTMPTVCASVLLNPDAPSGTCKHTSVWGRGGGGGRL